MLIDEELKNKAGAQARKVLAAMADQDPEKHAAALANPAAFELGFLHGVDSLMRLQLRRSLRRPGKPLDGDWLGGEEADDDA